MYQKSSYLLKLYGKPKRLIDRKAKEGRDKVKVGEKTPDGYQMDKDRKWHGL